MYVLNYHVALVEMLANARGISVRRGLHAGLVGGIANIQVTFMNKNSYAIQIAGSRCPGWTRPPCTTGGECSWTTGWSGETFFDRLKL